MAILPPERTAFLQRGSLGVGRVTLLRGSAEDVRFASPPPPPTERAACRRGAGECTPWGQVLQG